MACSTGTRTRGLAMAGETICGRAGLCTSYTFPRSLPGHVARLASTLALPPKHVMPQARNGICEDGSQLQRPPPPVSNGPGGGPASFKERLGSSVQVGTVLESSRGAYGKGIHTRGVAWT